MNNEQKQELASEERLNQHLQRFLSGRKAIEVNQYGKKVLEIDMQDGYVGLASKLKAVLMAIECVGYATEVMNDLDMSAILPPLIKIATDLIAWGEAEFLDNITEAKA